jgi:hypothetical protein
MTDKNLAFKSTNFSNYHHHQLQVRLNCNVGTEFTVIIKYYDVTYLCTFQLHTVLYCHTSDFNYIAGKIILLSISKVAR